MKIIITLDDVILGNLPSREVPPGAESNQESLLQEHLERAVRNALEHLFMEKERQGAATRVQAVLTRANIQITTEEEENAADKGPG